MCVWVFYSQKYIPKAKETDPATKYLHNLPYHSLTAHTYCLAYFVRSIIFYTRIRSPSRACSLEATIGNPPKISLFSFLWSWHIFTVAFFRRLSKCCVMSKLRTHHQRRQQQPQHRIPIQWNLARGVLQPYNSPLTLPLLQLLYTFCSHLALSQASFVGFVSFVKESLKKLQLTKQLKSVYKITTTTPTRSIMFEKIFVFVAGINTKRDDEHNFTTEFFYTILRIRFSFKYIYLYMHVYTLCIYTDAGMPCGPITQTWPEVLSANSKNSFLFSAFFDNESCQKQLNFSVALS